LLNNINNNENTLAIQLAFIKTILRVSDFYKNSENLRNTAQNSEILIINKIIAYINENYRKKIKVEEIAEFAHMSYSYLSNIKKKTPAGLLLNI